MTDIDNVTGGEDTAIRGLLTVTYTGLQGKLLIITQNHILQNVMSDNFTMTVIITH